jgi:uncharacterized phage-like protein YoqJ
MIVSATGHRPFQKDKKTGLWVSKLEYPGAPGNSVLLYNRLIDLGRAWLRKNPDVSIVISGAAMGWDLAIARATILENRELHMYIPYSGHGESWKTFYKDEHKDLVEKASKVVVPESSENVIKALLQRNKDMVDNSEFLLALWDGSSGGTAHCVNYAMQKYGEKFDKKFHNLWPSWIKYRSNT